MIMLKCEGNLLLALVVPVVILISLFGCSNVSIEETIVSTQTQSIISPSMTPTGETTPIQRHIIPTSTPDLLIQSQLPVISVENVASLTNIVEWVVEGYPKAVWVPDSTRLAIANQDSVYLYDTRSFERSPLVTNTKWPWSLTFSPDGRTLAVIDYGIQLSDAATGDLLRRFDFTSECNVEVNDGIAFHPTSNTIITGYIDDYAKIATFYLWDVDTGQCLNEIGSQEGWIYTEITFGMDGNILRTGTDLSTSIWDFSTGDQICQFDKGYSAISPDGEILAISPIISPLSLFDQLENYGFSLIDLSTCQTFQTIDEDIYASEFAFSPDGYLLAVGGVKIMDDVSEYVIQIINTNSGELIRELDGIPAITSALTFSPDGRYLLAKVGTLFPDKPFIFALWGIKQ